MKKYRPTETCLGGCRIAILRRDHLTGAVKIQNKWYHDEMIGGAKS